MYMYIYYVIDTIYYIFTLSVAKFNDEYSRMPLKRYEFVMSLENERERAMLRPGLAVSPRPPRVRSQK